MRLRSRVLTVVLALLGGTPGVWAQAPRFTPRSVEIFEVLPIQDGGRIKPISTYADFTLLRISGRKSLTREAGEQKTSVRSSEWLLDVLFQPELAADDRVFMVADDAALDAIGLAHVDKRKRDRYSLRELQPGIDKLFEKANEYGHLPDKERNSVQTEIVNLAEAVDLYGSLSGRLGLAVVPPDDAAPKDAEWLTPDEVALRETAPMFKDKLSAKQKQIAAGFAELQRKRDDPGAFELQLAALSAQIVPTAEARHEYDRIPLERFYYSADLLTKAQVVFVLAFLAIAFAWLMPRAKLPYRGAALLAVAGTAAVRRSRRSTRPCCSSPA